MLPKHFVVVVQILNQSDGLVDDFYLYLCRLKGDLFLSSLKFALF